MTIADDPLDVFQGGGEVGNFMRTRDWAATPLGAPSAWPRSLQSIVRMMLNSRYQMRNWGQSQFNSVARHNSSDGSV